MSKNTILESEIEEKDEQTAKFLHKLAENGKDRKMPDCVVAFYGRKAWEAMKIEEKFKACEECGHPPPPPSFQNSGSCRNCGKSVKSSEPENLKLEEKRKSLKRDSSTFKTPKPEKEAKVKVMPRKIAATPPPAIIPPPLLQSKSSAKKLKKMKIPVEKEPDFLQKLFGIGANPV